MIKDVKKSALIITTTSTQCEYQTKTLQADLYNTC